MSAEPVAPPVGEDSDAALIDAHLAGVPHAFDELCRRYERRLISYLARRTDDRELARDLAQDALLRAYESLATFDTEYPLWPWLKSIAGNVATDHDRSAQRRSIPTEDESLVAAGDTTPLDDPCEMLAERQVLVTAMASLSPRQRAAVGLRYLDDWSVADVGDVLGMEANAAGQLLMRARRRLCIEYRRVTAERLRAWAWPLLLPYYRLRDRLARVRDAFVGAAPGPALATAEALSITAAVTVLAAAVAMSSVTGPLAAAASTGPRPPAAVAHGAEEAHPTGWQGATHTVGMPTGRPASAVDSASSSESAPLILASPTDPDSTNVRATPRFEANDEATSIVIEEERTYPLYPKPEGGRVFLEWGCEGPVSERVCEAARLVPEEP